MTPKLPHIFELWIVVYLDTEKNQWLPCYDCGLHQTRGVAEDRRCRSHPSGCPTDTVELTRRPPWTNEVPTESGWYWCQNVGDTPGRLWEAIVHWDAVLKICSWLSTPGIAGQMTQDQFSPETRFAGPINHPPK